MGESLPAEVGFVSPNAREYYTKQYKAKVEGDRPVVLVIKTVVLGNRRPYNLSVEVNVVSSNMTMEPQEAFQNGTPYVGEESLSKRIVTKVQSELAKRRKNKNLFDDFRAF